MRGWAGGGEKGETYDEDVLDVLEVAIESLDDVLLNPLNTVKLSNELKDESSQPLGLLVGDSVAPPRQEFINGWRKPLPYRQRSQKKGGAMKEEDL